jgi:hypothetical protein
MSRYLERAGRRALIGAAVAGLFAFVLSLTR